MELNMRATEVEASGEPLDFGEARDVLIEATRQRQALLDDPSFVTRLNSGEPGATTEMLRLNSAIGTARDKMASASENVNTEGALREMRAEVHDWTREGRDGFVMPGEGGGNDG